MNAMHAVGVASAPATAVLAAAPEGTLLHRAIETLTLRAGANTNWVIAGTTLLGLAAGVVGVFAMLRKRALVADALSHATLPGIALAFLGAAIVGAEGRSLSVLLLGATVSGTLGILCIQGILRYSRLREDAAIGIVLSVFFGAGIVGLSYIQANAPEGSAGLKSFIYGQAATLRPPDVAVMAGIAIAAVAATFLLLKEFTLVCFNDAFAKVDGWPVSAIDLAMMSLLVLVTVAGLQAVGLILVIAMLIIPPVSARFWTERLWLVVVIAGALGAASGFIGSVASSLFPRLPAGAVIVLVAGALFAFSLAAAPARGAVASALRHLRLRLRIEGDHLLEHAHERAEPAITDADLAHIARLRSWSAVFRPILLASLRLGGMIAPRPAAGGLTITARGAERGARVARNHRLWERYLVAYADVAPSHIDWSVDRVEHVLSDQLVRELEQQLADRGVAVPVAAPDARGRRGAPA